MATTLIVNPGSTSKKYALYEDGQELISIRLEKTGSGFDVCEIINHENSKCQPVAVDQYKNALKYSLSRLLDGGYIKSEQEIEAVGVRVVAPGNAFAKHSLVDKQYIQLLEAEEVSAPLHIPPILEALLEVREILPQAKLVAASDSAFHVTHPEFVNRYSLPKSDADSLDIKRYGYHGLSVASIASRLQSVFGTVPARTLVCHIGGGISVTALKDGVSFDSSMGFSPMSGLMMSGRAGDIDGSAVLALLEKSDKSGVELHKYLNEQSGFAGILGASDMRQVLNLKNDKNPDAELAFSMFRYQFTKLVGGLMAGLGGVDALVLTATAAVRNPELRRELLTGLTSLGIEFDNDKNSTLINKEGRIENQYSIASIAVMKTDELGEIDKVVRQFL